MSDAAAAPVGCAASLATLPRSLQHDILARLPPDRRLLLAFVCRSLRDAVNDRDLWSVVDLSSTSGVARCTDKLLRAIAAKARCSMRSLDVSGRCLSTYADCDRLSLRAVVSVAQANQRSLQLLRLLLMPYVLDVTEEGSHRGYSAREVAHVLKEAPRTRSLEVDVCDTAAKLLPLFARKKVVLRSIHAEFFEDGKWYNQEREEAALRSLVANLADGQTRLTALELSCAPLDNAAQLDALVDAVLRLPALASFGLQAGDVAFDATMPALTRLVNGSARLARLCISRASSSPFPPPSPAFCAALQGAHTLACLKLVDVDLFRDAFAGSALVDAITDHPSLRCARLYLNSVASPHRSAVGAALGRLVAADAASLSELNMFKCDLGDAGLAPLFASLPDNHHLRTLCVGCGRVDPTSPWPPPVGVSRAFAGRLLAAVRANTSLRCFTPPAVIDSFGVDYVPELEEAEALVKARGAA